MENNDKTIDELIDQLKPSNINDITKEVKQQDKILKEEELTQFIINNASKVIQSGVESIEILKQVVIQADDAEEIDAFANLIKASANAIDTLNKINLQNRRIQADKDIKQMEVNARINLPISHNTNILIGTRDDIFKRIMDEVKRDKVIEVKAEVLPQESDSKNLQGSIEVSET